jgi:23S rRNA-/tRNA-specific pseudouridylate synthase
MIFKDHIIYEDDFILVMNKPTGLMVEPDRNNNPSLLQYVKEYLKKHSLREQNSTHNIFTALTDP